MKLCYGFATEEAFKETRKSAFGEHARGDTHTAQITAYKTKLALASGQSPAPERGKIVGCFTPIDPDVSEEPILIFWKELSKNENVHLLRTHIPSIYKVCQYEMYERSKNMQK